jgi:hypothetical protein
MAQKTSTMKRIIALIIFSIAALAGYGQIFTNTPQLRFVNRAKLTAADTAANVANDGRMWYDESTDEIRFIKGGVVYSVSHSSGITNTAASNEIPKSNGTNIVPSGLFSTSTANLDLGTSSTTGSTRIIQPVGTATDISLSLRAKGSSGVVTFRNATQTYGFVDINGYFFTQLTGVFSFGGTGDIYSDLGLTVRTFDKGVNDLNSSDVIIKTGDAGSGGAGNHNSGNIYITPGAKTGSGTVGNIALFNSSGSFGAGEKVLQVANATTVPSSNPASGVLLYASGGAIYSRTSGGVVTNLSIPLTSNSASTVGGTVTLDMNSEFQRMFVGSATFASSKTIALSNTTNALVFDFHFEVTNVAATLVFPASFLMADTNFNTGTDTWTPPSTGKYEMGASYDGTNWKVKITGPFL